MPATKMLSATTIVETGVVNPTGEDLGEIKDLVIDLEEGVISYAVLSFGGFMGMGNKWFAIPWQAFEPSASEKKFVLNVPEQALKDAEGFDKDHWPEMDRNWGASLHEHYGYRPYWDRERSLRR